MKKLNNFNKYDIIAIAIIVILLGMLATNMAQSRAKYIDRFQMNNAYNTLKDAMDALHKKGYIDDRDPSVTQNKLPYYMTDNSTSINPYTSTYKRNQIYSFLKNKLEPQTTTYFKPNSLCSKMLETFTVRKDWIQCENYVSPFETDFNYVKPTIRLQNGMTIYFSKFFGDPKDDLNLRMAIKDYQQNIIPELIMLKDSDPQLFSVLLRKAYADLERMFTDGSNSYAGASYETGIELIELEHDLDRILPGALGEINWDNQQFGLMNSKPDYYTVFIDMNGPDKGKNKENVDVLKFRLYRTGHLLPESKVLKNNATYIVANVFYQVNTDKRYLLEKVPLDTAMCKSGNIPMGEERYNNNDVLYYCSINKQVQAILPECKVNKCQVEIVKFDTRF